jgi:hypothetical protein
MSVLPGEIVTALSSGAGDRLAAVSSEAIGRLLSALRARFRGDAIARGALEIAAEDPRNAAARAELEELLRARIREDAGFGAWLEALWSEIGPAIREEAGRSANIIHGTVRGSVVQARDVQGGIHIGGDSAGRAARRPPPARGDQE